MLDDIRVLEISAPETMLGGQILADLGADVVVVEPPSGAAGRRLDPFFDGVPGLERSLTWHALNRNKRGITLDLGGLDGREIFKSLASRFDVLFESTGQGGAAPLDTIDLPEKMIRCSVSAFARTGPKSAYAATDLVTMASCGAPGMTGESDRAPIFFPVPQAMIEAGAEAAIAALAGLSARDRDGLGQRAEVSARIAAMMSAMSTPIVIASGNAEMKRSAGIISIAGVGIPTIYECKDGYALVTIAFGAAFGPMTQRLVKWAADEGRVEPRIAEIDWSSAPYDLASAKVTPADLQAMIDGVRALCLSKTKAEIGEAARSLGLLASPVMDMKDVAESEQYRARGLWTPVAVGDRQIEAPARFAQFSNYSIETVRPAPALSQHTVEVLGEVGITQTETQALFVHGII